MNTKNLIVEAIGLRQKLRAKLYKAENELRRTVAKQIHKFAALSERVRRLTVLVERAEARLQRREDARKAVERGDLKPNQFLRVFVERDTLFFEVVEAVRVEPREGGAPVWKRAGGSKFARAAVAHVSEVAKLKAVAPFAFFPIIARLKRAVADIPKLPSRAGFDPATAGGDISVVTVTDAKTKAKLVFRFDAADREDLQKGRRINWAKVVGEDAKLSPEVKNAALMALLRGF